MSKTICLVALLATIFALFSVELAAHPEDEFCNGEGLDPLLCAQLADLDSSEGGVVSGKEAAAEGQKITLDRSAWSTLALYIGLGFEHILPAGTDHLLFVLALLLVCKTPRTLLLQISCFTLAHSITLIAASLGLANFSSEWIELLIALSIVAVGLENIFLSPQSRHRFFIVFGFGLLHGLGFAGALGEVGLPSEHFVIALLGFNLGVELGQLVFAAAVFLALALLMKKDTHRYWIVVLGSAALVCVALFWTYERWLVLLNS